MRRVAPALGIAGATWAIIHQRAPAVRAWQRPDLPTLRHGPLHYRAAGPADADTGIVLLHGLVATGDVFGETPSLLAKNHRVVVPDLLGFGRSLDERRSDFSTAAHLDALDDLITHELGDRRIRIGAHSMGSALALRWAAANPDRVDRVVCLGAPIYAGADAARSALGELGPMGRSLILDDRVARAICTFNCRHRTLAGLLSALAAPRWPIPIARQASLHTWPAYISAIEEQIIDCPWGDLVDTLGQQRVSIHLVRGDRDSIGDPDVFRELAAVAGVDSTVVDGDHTLPSASPALLVAALAAEGPTPRSGA